MIDFDFINNEINKAHVKATQEMTEADQMADITRMKREMNEEMSYYKFSKEEMKWLQKLINDLSLFNKATLKKRALITPFNSVNTKEREFARSKEIPNDYYDFRYFGVRITIWRHNPDDYSIACIGWYPNQSKRFTWRQGYAGKYAYYNRCNDLETAIVDWLLCITEFFTTELGIYMGKQQKLDLDKKVGTLGSY